MRDDHALHARDDTDAGQLAGAYGEPGTPRGEGGQLEERAVRVQQQLDALPHGQLPAVAVALLVALAPARDGEVELLVELGEHGELRPPITEVALRRRVEQ